MESQDTEPKGTENAGPGSEEKFRENPMLGRLMDLELPLAVALGRATMAIQDVLKITSGSTIELDRNVGDYVELLVHGVIVARGEIVSLKGNYGVRIKEIISHQDRMALHGEEGSRAARNFQPT